MKKIYLLLVVVLSAFAAFAADSKPVSYKSGDDTVQGAEFLLGALRALKEAAQIADHARTALPVAQKAIPYKLLLEVFKEVEQLLLCRRPAAAAAEGFRRGRCGCGEPLIADDQHRLGEVQR